MTLEFGDVLIVPFPFTNQATAKRRPAVVVSSRAYNGARQDVILMAVTSQVRATKPIGEYEIREWRAAGLLAPSSVKPVVATFEQTLIAKRLGAFSATDLQGLREVISVVFG